MSKPKQPEWKKTPEWRQVVTNTQRRASFGRNTRTREPAARWNGTKPQRSKP